MIMQECKAVHVYPCGCIYAEWKRPPFHPNEDESDLTEPDFTACDTHLSADRVEGLS